MAFREPTVADFSIIIDYMGPTVVTASEIVSIAIGTILVVNVLISVILCCEGFQNCLELC